MKHLVTAIAIALLAAGTGCDVPGRPALRIGISQSPGSAVMYLAQEHHLFEHYLVDVELVELNDGHECWTAFAHDRLDAVVMPYSELAFENQANSNEAGVLMLLASSGRFRDTVATNFAGRWKDGELDVLVGSRGDLMQRRVEWQRVLHAYEHARLLLTSGNVDLVKFVAEYEHRPAHEIIAEVKEWQFFGVQQQDSLLSVSGPYKDLKARWQGQFDFSTMPAQKADQLLEGKQVNVPGEKVR